MKKLQQPLLGQVRKSSSIAEFDFVEMVYPNNLKLPLHSHNFAYFCFVLDGNFSENNTKNEYLCQPSTSLFHPSGERHSNYFHTTSRCFNVQISPKISEWLHDGKINLRQAVIQDSFRINHLVTRLYNEFYETDEFSPLTVEGLILEVAAEFLRDSSKISNQAVPKWLLQARDFISEEFSTILTISRIAATVDIHPTHLCREFRRYFQMTIGDFIRQRRIESACQSIINSDKPLAEISLEAGFYDQSHFSNAFKSQVGMTPLEYRQTTRR